MYKKNKSFTNIIILINLAVFFIEYILLGQNIFSGNVSARAMLNIGATNGYNVFILSQYWRLITGMFEHASLMHLFSNMLVFYFTGRTCEYYFGQKRFLIIYILSGIGGGLINSFFDPMSVAVGASGAIFGVFGAMLIHSIMNYKDSIINASNFLTYSLLIGLNILTTIGDPTIGILAHIGGVMTGSLIAYIMIKRNKKRKKAF